MPVQINWSVNVQVADGPQLGIAQTDSISGYDMVDVAIPPSSGSNTTSVDLQPGSASQVRFLLITSSDYGAKLTYTVEGASGAVPLDTPQLLAGSGAIGLLQKDPKKLLFSNKLDGGPTVILRILVGAEGGGDEGGADEGGAGGGGSDGGGDAGGGDGGAGGGGDAGGGDAGGGDGDGGGDGGGGI
jgi:hypothetical protein